MVMALAASSPSQLAVSFLQKLPSLDLEPMVHLAASDAIVRTSKDVDSAVLSILRSGDLMQVDGAIRALAMTRTVPSNSTIQAIIVFASEPGRSQIRFWVAAASPAWPKAIVGHFLKQCLIDDGVDIRRAAKAAIERRYLEWAPL